MQDVVTTHDRPNRPPRRTAAGADSPGWTRRHRIAFRIYSVVVSLLVLAFFSFALLEVVISWLPDETLRSIDDGESPGGVLIHRTHLVAIGLVAWTIVPAVLVQLRRPWRRGAPMLVAAVMGIAGAVAFGLSGTLGEWIVEDLILTALLLGLAALHPRARHLVRRPGFDRDQLAWAVLGAVPWAGYALSQAELQLRASTADPHAMEEHWAVAFMLAVAVITCAVVGSSDRGSWQLPAWTAALAAAIFGVHSAVFPDLASGLSTPWALAAVAWAAGYAALTFRRSARIRRTPDATGLAWGSSVDAGAGGS